MKLCALLMNVSKFEIYHTPSLSGGTGSSMNVPRASTLLCWIHQRTRSTSAVSRSAT